MSDPFFFGYGSLVNQATHDFPEAQKATLHGWKRLWQRTDLRQVAFLSAVPCTDTDIDGLIAHVPNDDWEALDQREWAYDRIKVTEQVSHPVTRALDIAVYSVPERHHATSEADYPILLSYLDVVLQGYLHEFGETGVTRFMQTTSGWETLILNDRAQPVYPRAQPIPDEQRAYVDEILRNAGLCPILREEANVI